LSVPTAILICLGVDDVADCVGPFRLFNGVVRLRLTAVLFLEHAPLSWRYWRSSLWAVPGIFAGGHEHEGVCIGCLDGWVYIHDIRDRFSGNSSVGESLFRRVAKACR